MRLAIVGSRNWDDLDAVRRYIARLPFNTVVITGGWVKRSGNGRIAVPCEGVDRAAYVAAVDYGLIPVLVCANWDAHGKAAGIRRNPEIVAIADRVVAFWTGSNGTGNTIDHARSAGKLERVFQPGECL